MDHMLIKAFGNELMTLSTIFIVFIISVALGEMGYKIFEIIALVIGKIFRILFDLFGMVNKTESFVEFVLINLWLFVVMFLIGFIIVKTS